MLSKFMKYLEDKERAWRSSFGNDISTPAARRKTQRHFDWVDHGILRIWWTNFDQVADGVFRSNQPSAKRLKAYRDQGIKSVLNLRGPSDYSHYLFEREACDALGLHLADISLSSTELPTLETIHQLEQHFTTLEKPFVLHCKSGADRAGFAAALYQLLICDTPIEVARRQLSFRYLHVKASRTGVLDYCLDEYTAANAARPIAFRDWMMNVYDPQVLSNQFRAKRKRGKKG